MFIQPSLHKQKSHMRQRCQALTEIRARLVLFDGQGFQPAHCNFHADFLFIYTSTDFRVMFMAGFSNA